MASGWVDFRVVREEKDVQGLPELGEVVEVVLDHDVRALQVRLHVLLVGREDRLEDAVLVQIRALRELGLLQVPEHALHQVVMHPAHHGNPHVKELCTTAHREARSRRTQRGVQ